MSTAISETFSKEVILKISEDINGNTKITFYLQWYVYVYCQNIKSKKFENYIKSY